MYKRAKDFLSELNSVPMLGKRDPEAYSHTDNTKEAYSNTDEEQAEEGSVWASYPEQGNIMDDVSLVGLILPSRVSTSLRKFVITSYFLTFL